MAVCETVMFEGRRYYRRCREKYFQKNGKLLHRVVWESAHGPIPAGHVIHHVDFDPVNNALDNLRCMTVAEHTALHKDSSAHKHRTPEKLLHLQRIRPLASAWHRTDAGRAWHSENSRRAWATRSPTQAVCSECGGGYETFFPERSRFCSPRCGNRRYEREHPRPSRYKLVPKPDKRNCEVCGGEYQPTRDTERSYCSRKCRNAGYHRARKSAAPAATGV